MRSCYKENLEKFREKRNQLTADQTLKVAYIGTSGIGKSGFLQLLLISLVHEAKSNGVVYTIRLKVFISDRSPPQDWLFHTDGRCSFYNQERVYLILLILLLLIFPMCESHVFLRLQKNPQNQSSLRSFPNPILSRCQHGALKNW